MIGSELVDVSRRGDQLRVRPLDPRRRAVALDLASRLLAAFSVGVSREELDDVVAAIEPAPRDRRLFLRLRKMIEDRSSFEAAPPIDPITLRAEAFAAATAARRASSFDRSQVLSGIALARGLDVAALDAALFADLRSAERLIAVCPLGPNALLSEHDREQIQAVLLRAVKLAVEIDPGSPEAARALFRRLKFLQLLYSIHVVSDGKYRLEIDGPFSLFEQVTKYGLKLALVVPLLEETRSYRLEASVRWGKARTPLIFTAEGGGGSGSAAGPSLSDDLEELLDRLRKIDHPWRIEPCNVWLDLPGAGICFPDLTFTREDGARVFVEVLGHWSRAAVWKRVELVEAGLCERVIFAVSDRLRVSEEVIGEDAPSSIYVYKGKISAKTLLERVEVVSSRPCD